MDMCLTKVLWDWNVWGSCRPRRSLSPTLYFRMKLSLLRLVRAQSPTQFQVMRRHQVTPPDSQSDHNKLAPWKISLPGDRLERMFNKLLLSADRTEQKAARTGHSVKLRDLELEVKPEDTSGLLIYKRRNRPKAVYSARRIRTRTWAHVPWSPSTIPPRLLVCDRKCQSLNILGICA